MCLSRINLKFITKYTTYNAKNGANLLRWITVYIWSDYENMKIQWKTFSKSLWINKVDFRSKSKHFINKYKDMSRINLNSISQYSFDIKCFDIVFTKRKNSRIFLNYIDMSRTNLNCISKYSFDIKCFDIVFLSRGKIPFF